MAKKLQRKISVQSRAKSPGGPAGPGGRLSGIRLPGGRKVPMGKLSEFTVQLATLLDAGIPIVRALRILEGQMPPGPFKEVLQQVTRDVESGSALSEAMEKHPKVFDTLYTNMVRAGELGGVQDVILLRLAEFMGRIQEIRSRVKGALFYPVVVLGLAFAVITVLLVFVIPTFAKIFARERIDLPWITQTMMNLSEAVQKWGWVVLLGAVLLYLLHRVLLAKSAGYRLGRDRLLLRIPILGDMQRKSLLARFARTFGTLIQSGVPHLEALEIVKASLGNREVQRAVEAIRSSIREGEGLARPMQESPVFDDIVVNMVDVGEETGELDRMLLKIAERYEKEVDQKIFVIFKVIEPVIIVFLAVVVGLIMASLLLPMVELVQRLGRGV